MRNFWELFLAILFGYGPVDLSTGRIISRCQKGIDKCSICKGDKMSIRSLTMDDSRMGILLHANNPNLYHVVGMNTKDEYVNKIIDILLEVWKSVLPPECQETYSKEFQKTNIMKHFNTFLKWYVWGLRTLSLNEQPYNIPEEKKEDMSDSSEDETDHITRRNSNIRMWTCNIQVSNRFTNAIMVSVREGELGKLGLSANIFDEQDPQNKKQS
jgi:hypothetical protein